MALSSKQAECLKLMILNPKAKGRELAEILNVTEKTISQWKNHNADFQTEYKTLVESKLQYAAAQALEKQIALLGSKNDMVAHLAAKDLLDRTGFKPTEKVEQSIDMELTVTIDYGAEE